MLELAFAMAPPPDGADSGSGSLLALLPPMIMMFLIFYFILIRPQQKKQQEARKMLDDLNEGDNVVTLSGIHGTIKKLKDDNASQEYYLTDLLGVAIENGDKVSTVEILPEEAVGINTKEHLEKVNQDI